jgi:hypothetical protein
MGENLQAVFEHLPSIRQLGHNTSERLIVPKYNADFGRAHDAD